MSLSVISATMCGPSSSATEFCSSQRWPPFSRTCGPHGARRIAEFIVQLAEHPVSALSTLLAAAWGGLILAPICWFRFFRLWKLRRQLSQGIPLDENTRHPRSPARTYFYWGVPIALEVISFSASSSLSPRI